jgi:5-methylcytosine-specific restriction endonuclease McrA
LTQQRGGQDVAYCSSCGQYAGYNASKEETGREARSLRSRSSIAPSRRFRILAIHDHRCVSCGKAGIELQLDHLVSRQDAERLGFLDQLIESDWNLVPMCAECNSGKRQLNDQSLALVYRTLLIKATPKP